MRQLRRQLKLVTVGAEDRTLENYIMGWQKELVGAMSHGHFFPQALTSWTFSKSISITWNCNYKGIY